MGFFRVCPAVLGLIYSKVSFFQRFRFEKRGKFIKLEESKARKQRHGGTSGRQAKTASGRAKNNRGKIGNRRGIGAEKVSKIATHRKNLRKNVYRQHLKRRRI